MLNPVFPNYSNQAKVEQDILETNIIEMIQIHGDDVYYMPRTAINNDRILNEDEYSEFNSAHVIEAYVRNFEGFEGQGQMLSKFHLETRDELSISISIKRFKQLIPERPDGPRDGDLIYSPLTKSIWEVLYSSSRKTFYALGKLYTYKFKLALLEFDNQRFSTGILAIDAYNNLTTDSTQDLVDSSDIITNPFDDSNPIQTEANTILDFTETTPFTGTF